MHIHVMDNCDIRLAKPIRSEFSPKAKRVRTIGRLNKVTSPLGHAMKRIWLQQWSLFECHTIILRETDAHEKIVLSSLSSAGTG